jgi:phenylpropionate dioxygenase-like ring-hydroxylating dioxygenase large terminal subunit
MEASYVINALPPLDQKGWPVQTPSREIYNSFEWFERDIDRIYGRHWLFVCHVSEILNVGDYVTYELAGDSIVVTRDKNTGINAFYNVGRHYGSAMMDANEAARRAKRVRTEVWNGMIFVNLKEDGDLEPLYTLLRNADISAHRLEHAKVIAAKIYTTEANWKINAETFQECYHCTPVHANSLAKIQVKDEDYQKAYEDVSQSTPDEGEQFLIFCPDLREGGWAPGVETLTLDGRLICSKLLGDTRQPPQLLSWFPNFSVGVYPDHAIVIDWVPISPRQTAFRTRWLVHENAVEDQDYDLAKVMEMAEKFNLEDKRMVERQQQGVNSRGYQPGPYNIPLEDPTRQWMAQYLREISR